ncbi:class I SAM-dependent methyltransferase [Nocardia niwae]|uniref:Class I SAM-dependent methyltransferase n=1 Tax=Nocardia niwae TaxID=626084 RepID=A0ABV2X959_9NOCA|nr:class I SAM-dependent methyltransferase [Nocardia niwae]
MVEVVHEYSSALAAEYWGRTRLPAARDNLEAVLAFNRSTEWNNTYDEWHRVVLARALPEDISGLRILDIGCGVGRISIGLARRGGELTCVDVSNEMLDVLRRTAAEHAVRVETVQGDALSVVDRPGYAGSFDIVACLGLVEHLPPEALDSFLADLVRMCAPGGTLVLEVNSENSVFLAGDADNPFRSKQQQPNGYLCNVVPTKHVLGRLVDCGMTVSEIYGSPATTVVRHLIANKQVEVAGKMHALAIEADSHPVDDISDHLSEQFVYVMHKPGR